MLGGNAAGSPVPVLDSFLLVDIMSMYAGYIHIHLFIVIYSDTPRQPKLFAPKVLSLSFFQVESRPIGGSMSHRCPKVATAIISP